MQIRSSISATHAHRYIHVLGGAMLASSPGSSHFFNVARRKTRERAWYLIARDQPTTVQSMGRVQIARRQCLSPSMQGTASARGERMRRHNVSQVRHCRHANLYPSPSLAGSAPSRGWPRRTTLPPTLSNKTGRSLGTRLVRCAQPTRRSAEAALDAHAPLSRGEFLASSPGHSQF